MDTHVQECVLQYHISKETLETTYISIRREEINTFWYILPRKNYTVIKMNKDYVNVCI